MKITTIKTTTETKEITIGYKCDNCRQNYKGGYLPEAWHEFSGYHNEWGNDSHESIQLYTACSPACYVSLLKKAVSGFEDYHDGLIDDFTLEFAKKLAANLTTKG